MFGSKTLPTMNLLNFFRRFPNEEACRDHWRKLRQKHGVVCKKCQGTSHWWLESKQQFECTQCHFRTTLRSGTVMESSKLPFQYWYIAMHLMTNTKKGISALELQRQIGHKRYEPIWALMHKLRVIMGKSDDQYLLEGMVELDEGFFETAYTPEEDPVSGERKPLKRGRGSQRQAKVVVMTSTEKVPKVKQRRYGPKTRLKYVRMRVVDMLDAGTLDRTVSWHINANSTVITDQYKSYKNIKYLIYQHLLEDQPEASLSKGLPWVHTMISNAKRLLLGMFHSVSAEYIQNYLNEFCYRTNRRFRRDQIFDGLAVAAVSLTWF